VSDARRQPVERLKTRAVSGTLRRDLAVFG
jgi:hypothetical protein